MGTSSIHQVETSSLFRVAIHQPSLRSHLMFATAKMLQIALKYRAGPIVKGSIQSLEQLPRGWCWDRDRVAGLPEFDAVD